MRVLIGLAAIAVLGCAATDMLLFATTMNALNTSILIAQNAAAEEAAERRRQERPECCHTKVYDESTKAWRCTGCDDERRSCTAR